MGGNKLSAWTCFLRHFGLEIWKTFFRCRSSGFLFLLFTAGRVSFSWSIYFQKLLIFYLIFREDNLSGSVWEAWLWDFKSVALWRDLCKDEAHIIITHNLDQVLINNGLLCCLFLYSSGIKNDFYIYKCCRESKEEYFLWHMTVT